MASTFWPPSVSLTDVLHRLLCPSQKSHAIIILELTMRMGQGPFHFRSQEQNLMLHCAQLDSQLILFSPALEASRTRMFIVDHHAQKTRYTFSAKNALLAFRSYASPPEPRGNRGGT